MASTAPSWGYTQPPTPSQSSGWGPSSKQASVEGAALQADGNGQPNTPRADDEANAGEAPEAHEGADADGAALGASQRPRRPSLQGACPPGLLQLSVAFTVPLLRSF